MAKAIPDGYHSVTPYLVVSGAAAALEFYEKAFGATEVMRMQHPDGKIAHAEMKIGDSHIMIADEYPELGFRGPTSLGGAAVSLMLYVDDAETTFKQALSTGAQEMQPMEDKFYGDRAGTLKDPFGHIWTIATHVEDIPPAEMERRAGEYLQKQNQ